MIIYAFTYVNFWLPLCVVAILMLLSIILYFHKNNA